jgi:Rho GDP-dissociation inhibitor
VDLKTLVNQDAGDESLRKYKEALLGNVANTYSPKDDPRRVVITQLKIVVEGKREKSFCCLLLTCTSGRPDIVYALDTPASIKALKDKPFTLKEGERALCGCFFFFAQIVLGCKYKIEVSFRVQHEIVSGLCFVNSVYKGPIKVTTDKVSFAIVFFSSFSDCVVVLQEMLGSYGPKQEPYVCTTPRRGWEEAPTGAVYRGNFKARYLSLSFAFFFSLLL